MGGQFSELRLVNCVSNPWTSIFSMLFELNVELQRHIGDHKQFDDITLIALRRKTGADSSRHSICRTAYLHHLEELRDFVESAATHDGLKPNDVFAFKLAVDEICANIIQYGYAGREPGLLSLSFTAEAGMARLIIRDDGKYFPPSQAKSPDLEASLEDREIGGLGIFFVRELMDNVTYNRTEQNFNQLILEKKIN
jgi:serine/threonine-protein kinase RsbW